MKQITIYLGALLVLFTACSTPPATPPKFEIQEHKNSIFILKQGKTATLKQLSKEIAKYPVIFVGDHHTSVDTHEFMNALLGSLIADGYRVHLANEWFSPKHDKLLQRYTQGKISSNQLKKQRGWDKLTSLDWGLSSRLYETIRRGGGRLYGINLTRKARKRISSKLLSTMSPKERRFYDSLDTNVSAHKSLIEPFFENCHKMMPPRGGESCQERMYRVQVAWDSYMAQQSAKLAKRVLKTPRDKLVVFAGDMHMQYQLGIPLRFARLSNQPTFTIINHKTKQQKSMEKRVTLDVGLGDAVYIY